MKSKKDKAKILLALFWEFAKIGMFTIGGGMAMLPLIQQMVVKKGWLPEEETVDCIAVSQSLPGILAVNGATYIGKRVAGVPGAICASLGTVVPSFIIIILIVNILGTVSGNPVVEGAFLGAKAAVCGLVVVSAVRLGKKSIKNALGLILAAVALVLVAVLDINVLWVILLGAAVGVAYVTLYKDRREKP